MAAAMPTSCHVLQFTATVQLPSRALRSRAIGIEEGVGGGIVDLSGEPRERADRREQHHEIERARPASAASSTSVPCTFGASTAAGARRVFQLDHAVVEHAGGVQHAVDRAEALARLPHDRTHLLEVGDVGGGDASPARRALRGAISWRMRLQLGVGGVVRVEPARPLGLRRQCAATDQHQARLHARGEVLGHREADSAETAGDQIDALRAQALDLGWRQPQRLRSTAPSVRRRATQPPRHRAACSTRQPGRRAGVVPARSRSTAVARRCCGSVTFGNSRGMTRVGPSSSALAGVVPDSPAMLCSMIADHRQRQRIGGIFGADAPARDRAGCRSRAGSIRRMPRSAAGRAVGGEGPQVHDRLRRAAARCSAHR